MLDTLLNVIITDKKKALDILESEYKIPLITIQEEADTMCNLSIGVFNDGFNSGAVKNAVEVVKRLLVKSFSLDEALEVAGIDKEIYEKYSETENKSE